MPRYPSSQEEVLFTAPSSQSTKLPDKQKNFSDKDVELLARLVQSGDWTTVQYYFHFLISHYEQFLPQHRSQHCISNLTCSSELLVLRTDLMNNHQDQQLPSISCLYNNARTASILDNLNGLLVNIKVQQYFEALEKYVQR